MTEINKENENDKKIIPEENVSEFKEDALAKSMRLKEKAVKVCVGCVKNDNGFCSEYKRWCNFARQDCPKAER